jgi:hypothetical protein
MFSRIHQISPLFRLISCAALSVMMQSCVTTPSVTVMERADNLGTAPEWASFSTLQRNDDKHVRFLGYVEVPGDSLKSAAFNMADEKAMSEPMRSLVDAFLQQNQVGEDLRADGVFGRRIISATSGYRPAIPSLQVTQRYYEVVVVKSGIGEDETRLRVWSLAEASRHDFDRARASYLRRLNGEPEVKKILDNIGARQIEQVMKSDTKSQTQDDNSSKSDGIQSDLSDKNKPKDDD